MSALGTLIPFGYAIPDAETRLNEIMSDPETLLLDIRSRPVSRYRPQWNKSRLKAQWGRRFARCPECGDLLTPDFFGEPCMVEGQVVCETCMIVSELFQRRGRYDDSTALTP